MTAVDQDNFEMVDVLVGLGATVDLVDSDGWSAIHYAAAVASSKVMQLLLDALRDGAIVNAPAHDKGQRFPLHLASQRSDAQADDIEVVRLLLENGADIEARGNGETHSFLRAGIARRAWSTFYWIEVPT